MSEPKAFNERLRIEFDGGSTAGSCPQFFNLAGTPMPIRKR